MGLSAGGFRERVELQTQSTDTDTLGQPLNIWAQWAICWADVRHTSGLEAARAGSEVSSVRASVRIRWRDGVTAAMRVLIAGTPYDIKAVLPDIARREYLDLVCEVSR